MKNGIVAVEPLAAQRHEQLAVQIGAGIGCDADDVPRSRIGDDARRDPGDLGDRDLRQPGNAGRGARRQEPARPPDPAGRELLRLADQ